jgi:excisionase family DNA binding protein
MEAEKMPWNVKEAGSALGLSPWTIRSYISKRKLRVVRMGRRVLVEPDECRRLVKECRDQSRPEAV